jgi:predicted acyltransferase
LYALSIILDKLTWMISVGKDESASSLHEWSYRSRFQAMAGDINGSLLFAVSFVVMMWLIAWWLYRKNIFIKV